MFSDGSCSIMRSGVTVGTLVCFDKGETLFSNLISADHKLCVKLLILQQRRIQIVRAIVVQRHPSRETFLWIKTGWIAAAMCVCCVWCVCSCYHRRGDTGAAVLPPATCEVVLCFHDLVGAVSGFMQRLDQGEVLRLILIFRFKAPEVNITSEVCAFFVLLGNQMSGSSSLLWTFLKWNSRRSARILLSD